MRPVAALSALSRFGGFCYVLDRQGEVVDSFLVRPDSGSVLFHPCLESTAVVPASSEQHQGGGSPRCPAEPPPPPSQRWRRHCRPVSSISQTNKQVDDLNARNQHTGMANLAWGLKEAIQNAKALVQGMLGMTFSLPKAQAVVFPAREWQTSSNKTWATWPAT